MSASENSIIHKSHQALPTSNAILVTGAAGFIGFHVAKYLLDRGECVVGLDNLNHYYDVRLKEARLKVLAQYPHFHFQKAELTDQQALSALFERYAFVKVVHLAAQAGVRYSIENPHAYVESNLVGFVNILECCRHARIAHLVYASTSSVYGGNTRQPFSEDQPVEHPLALYAATKKANELMAHAYAHLYQLPTTGLRFFTVYGPWGRPDMALFLFTQAILANKPIQVFNQGQMVRDFTYVADIVEGIVRALDHTATPDPHWDGKNPNPATSFAPYRIYNIGNHQPVPLMQYIQALEKHLGKKAIYEMLPMQAGDVPATCADISRLENDLGYRPSISVEQGIGHFVAWYRSFYGD